MAERITIQPNIDGYYFRRFSVAAGVELVRPECPW